MKFGKDTGKDLLWWSVLEKETEVCLQYKLTLLQKRRTSDIFCNLISNNGNNKRGEHRRGWLDEGISEQELPVQRGKAKNTLLEIDYIIAEFVCDYVCVCMCACIQAHAKSSYTLPNSFHNPPFPAVCHHPQTSNERDAYHVSFSPSHVITSQPFFTLLLLFCPCISFFLTQVTPRPVNLCFCLSNAPSPHLTSPNHFVWCMKKIRRGVVLGHITNHFALCWSIRITFGTW